MSYCIECGAPEGTHKMGCSQNKANDYIVGPYKELVEKLNRDLERTKKLIVVDNKGDILTQGAVNALMERYDQYRIDFERLWNVVFALVVKKTVGGGAFYKAARDRDLSTLEWELDINKEKKP